MTTTTTSHPRPSFYREVHKGVRLMLGALVERAGRTDFTAAASVARLRNETVEIFALLEAHAHHEDEHLGPLLRAHAPATAADLCRRLQGEYDVAPEQCERDVLRFLHDLHARGLVNAAGPSAA